MVGKIWCKECQDETVIQINQSIGVCQTYILETIAGDFLQKIPQFLWRKLHHHHPQTTISFDPILKEQISASKALWVFSLRACTGIPCFKKCFLIQMWQNHSLWVYKKHHVLQDGLGSLLSHWLATKLKKLKETFMIMFDGTTTHQNRKYMDILLRFLDEDENQVVTKYSISIHFTRAKAVDVTEMLLKL